MSANFETFCLAVGTAGGICGGAIWIITKFLDLRKEMWELHRDVGDLKDDVKEIKDWYEGDHKN